MRQGTALLASPRVDIERARSHILARPHGEYDNSDVRRIVKMYFGTTEQVGMDPLIAISQMILETGNLTSHWSQRPRRNPAGIGVTGAPGEGVVFPSWRAAVRAHVGRLLAYALPKGSENLRQKALIEEALEWRALPDTLRGAAAKLRGLVGTWAADPEYAQKICRVADEVKAHNEP